MKGITVTIETPRHTAGKYVYDEDERCYKLKKILPLGMYFPYDFGMLQNTKAEDGDPEDVIVVTECVTYPGVWISCSLIGVLQANQIEKGKVIRNDRFIMVAVDSLVFAHTRDIGDFSGKHNEELKTFLINYARI